MVDMLDPSLSRVVVSGAHDYQYLEDLPSVKNNLVAMAEVLMDPNICGISENSCRTILQPETPGQVLDALYEAADECSDTLVFYFAGHGLTSPHNDELLLAIPTSHPSRPHSAVRFEDVRMAILSARKAPKKLVILDCCFSGRAMIGSMESSTDLAARSRIEGSYIITAAAETKTALAPPGERYTAFTGEFITLLRGGYAGGPAYLDMETIYTCLHDRLTEKSYPIPQQRNRNAGAKILLAKNGWVGGQRPEDSGQRLIDWYVDNAPGADPVQLRADATAEYIPYRRRISSALILGRLHPEFWSEACKVLIDLSADTHTPLESRAQVFGALARLGWHTELMKENLLALAKNATHGKISARVSACQQLDGLGDKEMAIEAYLGVVMDGSLELRLRAYTAKLMIQKYPEKKDAGLRVMWAAAASDSQLVQHRIDTIQDICSIDPDSVEKASILLRRIKSAASEGTQAEAQ
ncbi:caspase family protein [Streptomyces panaciradicis]|uniref:caspase family protein n=1 Tax=Streptomyces panaciradicis TaxID=1470261 RepID=UPI00201D11F0|nr:caspase family protein [Streptomyces panaciradicis]MCL6674455.1 caspase family protein [Streptomyces panaciradicis]